MILGRPLATILFERPEHYRLDNENNKTQLITLYIHEVYINGQKNHISITKKQNIHKITTENHRNNITSKTKKLILGTDLRQLHRQTNK